MEDSDQVRALLMHEDPDHVNQGLVPLRSLNEPVLVDELCEDACNGFVEELDSGVFSEAPHGLLVSLGLA